MSVKFLATISTSPRMIHAQVAGMFPEHIVIVRSGEVYKAYGESIDRIAPVMEYAVVTCEAVAKGQRVDCLTIMPQQVEGIASSLLEAGKRIIIVER